MTDLIPVSRELLDKLHDITQHPTNGADRA